MAGLVQAGLLEIDKVVRAKQQGDHGLLHLVATLGPGSEVWIFATDADVALSTPLVAPGCHLIVRVLSSLRSVIMHCQWLKLVHPST